MHTLLEGLPRSVALDADPARMRAYCEQHTAPHAGVAPIAIVQPAGMEQLVELILWANASNCPLVPVSSSGGPRRRGDTALVNPAVVVDLTAMKRMIHADAEDNIAVIEPGLTFGEFDRHLGNHGLRSFKPLLPRRGKSVLSSYLDREPITSPHDHWDSADPIAGAQLIFGSGETFRTGGAGVKGSLEEQLSKGTRQMMAAGPSATDFLRVVQGSQGSLAIAVWAAVYCEPIPMLERAFFISADALAPLVDLAYRILWRRVGGQVFIVNNTQLALMAAENRLAFERQRVRLPQWVLYVNLTAPNYLPEERMAYQVADLTSDAAELGLKVDDQIDGYRAASISAQQHSLPEVFYKDRALGSHREIFFLTQLDAAPKFVSGLNKLSAVQHSGLAGIYLQPRVQGVNCHFELTLPFDPADRSSSDRTAELAQLAVERFAELGAYFSRPHGVWFETAFAQDRTIPRYLQQVKDLFDPRGILNPGKAFGYPGASEQHRQSERAA